jgi:hypothetical protein
MKGSASTKAVVAINGIRGAVEGLEWTNRELNGFFRRGRGSIDRSSDPLS